MGITHVDVKEAYRLQAAEGYAYIDVRSIPEYEGGHPAGAQEDPILRDEILVAQEELLIDGARDVRQHGLPVHRRSSILCVVRERPHYPRPRQAD